MLVTLVKVILVSHGERDETWDFYVKAHSPITEAFIGTLWVACLDLDNCLNRVYSLFQRPRLSLELILLPFLCELETGA